MTKDDLFWSGKRIFERWHVFSTELASYIYKGLPAYRMEKGELHQVIPEEIDHFDADHMTDLLFDPSDVESFENKHESLLKRSLGKNETRLAAVEARELGRLRDEKHKWDSSVSAAVKIGIYCANLGRPVVRKEVEDEVFKLHPQLPNTTIDKMWKALPEKYRKGAGRPKKE